jgi:hypothetical protein
MPENHLSSWIPPLPLKADAAEIVTTGRQLFLCIQLHRNRSGSDAGPRLQFYLQAPRMQPAHLLNTLGCPGISRS